MPFQSASGIEGDYWDHPGALPLSHTPTAAGLRLQVSALAWPGMAWHGPRVTSVLTVRRGQGAAEQHSPGQRGVLEGNMPSSKHPILVLGAQATLLNVRWA